MAVADGTLSLAFGAVRVAVARDVRAAVHFFQLILAAGVADTLGLLLTLVWTAGFLPGFLAPQAVAVLLAKPVPRWGLLAGKYVGVLAFVLAQAVYFVGGTWLALALADGRLGRRPTCCAFRSCSCSLRSSSASRCCWPFASAARWSAYSARSPFGPSAGRSISAGMP